MMLKFIYQTARFITPLALIFLMACETPKTDQQAQDVVDRAIAFHGGPIIDHAQINFDFRALHFKVARDSGDFVYERFMKNEAGNELHDRFDNYGLKRKVNGKEVSLNAIENDKYLNAVNSVVYFALLPYNLNDAATIKQYVDEIEINGVLLDKIKVSFLKEGGGEDHDDEFYYWFTKEGHLQYLAYSEGGKRFRSVSKQQRINGVLFNNYINYKAPLMDLTPLSNFDRLFEKGELPELSRIELENITVEIIN